jgi:inosine-uridine nucleoside N-ribohydrolase
VLTSKENSALKIHLDTDLGGDIDDLCALAMLLRWSDVEIAAVTTVAEDNGKRAGYVRYVLSLEYREDIPVAAGADISLGCYRSKPGFPEEEIYWGKAVTPSPNALEQALLLLKKSIEQDATIVGIGPYTNLYLLEKRYPGILENARLYLMGGYVYPPRAGFPPWGVEMDYNIQVDVQSARYVIEHSNPTLVPLSVTVETSLRRAYLETLRNSGALGQLLARQAEAFARDENNEEKYGKTCSNLPNDTINFQHDPLTCAIALGWDEGVEITEIPLKLNLRNGWLHETIDTAGKPTRVVTKIDGNRFNEFWIATVSSVSRK